MFDLGWSELLVVAAVAIIVVGPKDLPKLMRTIGQWVRRARSLAAEFQRGMMDLADTADLKELKNLKKEVEEVTNFDMAGPDFSKSMAQPGAGAASANGKSKKSKAKSNGEAKPKAKKSASKKSTAKSKTGGSGAKAKRKAAKKAAETAS